MKKIIEVEECYKCSHYEEVETPDNLYLKCYLLDEWLVFKDTESKFSSKCPLKNKNEDIDHITINNILYKIKTCNDCLASTNQAVLNINFLPKRVYELECSCSKKSFHMRDTNIERLINRWNTDIERQNEKEKVKPIEKCPVCGDTTSINVTAISRPKSTDLRYAVDCYKCDYRSLEDRDRNTAVKLWNKIVEQKEKEETLKPCPFCDNKNIKVLIDNKPKKLTYKVTCSCGCSGATYFNRKDTIKSWNSRA